MAQQKPQFTQYIQNQFIINPAITGIENYIDVRLSHRHQWVGITDGPVTTYFSAHGPIGKKDYRTTATSYNMQGVNPRGRAYWEQYEAARPHSGIGIQLINDRTGPLNRSEAYLTYAYHLGLTPKTSLAAGFGAGIYQMNVDVDRLTNLTSAELAQALEIVNKSGQFNTIKPDFNAGLYLYSSDFFVGLSAQQIIPQQVTSSTGSLSMADSGSLPYLFLSGGYRFLMNEDFNVIPSVMLKYLGPLRMWQVEANAKFQYHDLAWVGVSYRNQFGFAAMLGLNISNKLNIGYSYDYTTSALNTFAKGTHEIVIGFLLKNTYGDSCPKNVW